MDVISLSAVLLNIIFAGLLYFHGRRNAGIVFFALIAFQVSVWSFAVFLMTSGVVATKFFIIGAFLHYFAGNLIFLSFFWFSVNYPKPAFLAFLFPAAISVIDGMLLIAILIPSFFFRSFHVAADLSGRINFNPAGFWIYTAYVVFLFIFAEITLFKKYFSTSGVDRLNLRYVILGTAVAGSLGVFSNLILPGLGLYFLFSTGPVFSTIFVGIISYAIFKHNLFNLKVIATEFFSFVIVFIFFVRFLLAQNAYDAIVDGGIFVMVSIFCWFLIRAVWKEVHDREEIAELASKLQSSNAELKKLDTAKSEFISLASHQLRTPLTVIRGYLSMIFEESFGSFSSELKTPLTNVMLSTEQLIRLVNDLLDLSRIEAGRIQYAMKSFPIHDLVKKVAGLLSGEAKEKGFNITIVNSLGEHRYIMGDFDKLSSAITNVVDNAIKHSQGHNVEIELEERISAGKVFIVVSVRDDGIGIAAEDIPKLFVKFSNVGGKSRYERAGGLGIGLYFTKRVIEDHSGKVWAESPGVGHGSTFYIEFPATTKN